MGTAIHRSGYSLAGMLIASSIALPPVLASGSGPLWEDEARLFGEDQESQSSFGEAVDLSGDLAIVGAFHADIGDNDSQGAAWIFRRDGDTWVEEAMLTASDGAEDDLFGFSVAIDGDIAIVGAMADDEEVQQGSAYYFRRGVGGVWVELAKIRSSDGDEQDAFGWSMDLEGTRLLVGASRAGSGTSPGGAAYVFELVGSHWIEQQKLYDPSLGLGDAFGRSVALDGETLAVGDSIQDGPGGDNAGAVYVYTLENSVWTLEQRLAASDAGTTTHLGSSVALDADVLLAGADQHVSGGQSTQGAAYVFRRSNGVWTEEQQLLASDAANNGRFYGTAVALRGNMALVGGESGQGNDILRGIVYDNRYIDGKWVEVGSFRAPVGHGLDTFGESIAFDGSRVVIGNSNNVLFEPHGTAWIYRLPPVFSDGFESGDTSAWSVTVP